VTAGAPATVKALPGDGARLGLNVRYSDEGPTLLGTAGAIRNALDLLARHRLRMREIETQSIGRH